MTPRPRSLFPLLMLLACTGAPPPPGPGLHRAMTDTVIAEPTPQDTPAALQPGTVVVEQALAKHQATREDEGCVEYIDASPAGARAVLYVRPTDMKVRDGELEGTLTSAWKMAEQAAPVSIADDFEHGISTEHRHMPDTLDVRLEYFANCSSRKPHTIRQFGVWRDRQDGVGWRER